MGAAKLISYARDAAGSPPVCEQPPPALSCLRLMAPCATISWNEGGCDAELLRRL